MIVYQLINFSQEEMLFGTTDHQLNEEVERIAKDPKGPTRHWKKGDVVQWRPLTMLLEPDVAKQLHRQLEAKTPPNKFKVIPTSNS